jgi:hypothetical protein
VHRLNISTGDDGDIEEIRPSDNRDSILEFTLKTALARKTPFFRVGRRPIEDFLPLCRLLMYSVGSLSTSFVTSSSYMAAATSSTGGDILGGDDQFKGENQSNSVIRCQY